MYTSDFPLSKEAERFSSIVINHGKKTLDEYGLRISNIADSHKEHLVIFAMNSTNPMTPPMQDHPISWLQNFIPTLRIHDDQILVRNLEEIALTDLLILFNRDYQKNWLQTNILEDQLGRLLRNEISNALRYRIWLIEDQIGSYEELKQVDTVIRILNRINRQLAIFDQNLFKDSRGNIRISAEFSDYQLSHFKNEFQIEDVYISAGEKAKTFHINNDCEGLAFVNYISQHSNAYPPFKTKIEIANSNGRKPCRYCFGAYSPPKEGKPIRKKDDFSAISTQFEGRNVTITYPELSTFNLRGTIIGRRLTETENDIEPFYEVEVRLNPKETKVSFFRDQHVALI